MPELIVQQVCTQLSLPRIHWRQRQRRGWMVVTVESIMNRSAQPLYNERYNNLGTPLATSLFYHDAVRSTTGDPSSLLLSDNTTLSPPLPHRPWPHITLDSNPHEE